MSNEIIQALCWGYRCEEAQLPGAEQGHCSCPCHEMPAEQVADFAADGLRAEVSTGE